jgi:5-formyltetrahydrofolate cyclo-ligase
MQDGIFEKKKALRGKYLEMRKALAKEDVEIMSGAVIKRLLKAINGNENSVLLYVPINNEVDLLPLARDLYMDKKKVLFPKLIGYKDIVPYIVDDLYFDFKPGAYNIPEPDTKPFNDNIDLAIIPGIAFGKDGSRIGYGKSFFDRFLMSRRVNKIIGVCYDFQILDELPHTDKDYPVDVLVSEKSFIEIKK